MPKNIRNPAPKKSRRIRQPNVFAQSEPVRRTDDSTQTGVATSTVDVVPRVRARVERVTRRASARSGIYTRSLKAELKKMGALAGVLAVALVVLTFVL